ncbi:MAG: hypothetical protein U0795_24895 [Pirellulales bacterium]
MNPEQRRIYDSKPIERMRRFARLLHWRGVQLERILFTAEQITAWDVPSAGIITYYVTTDLKFNLQINEMDTTPPFTHQATVNADRYGIRSVGWHPFTLFDEDERLRFEADRVRPWLDRNLYKDRRWLGKLRREHPEFLLPSRKRRRGHGFGSELPSSPSDGP